MTWSQLGIWTAANKFRPHDNYLNVRFRVEIPPDVGVDHVLTVVRDLVARHEALRTRYVRATGQVVTQEVAEHGEVEGLLQHSATESLDRLLEDLANRSFDLESELPVRFSIVHDDERPAWLLMVVSHVSIDGLARNRLIEEISARLAGDQHFGKNRPLLTPAMKARLEKAPDGIRRNELAIERWRRFLSRVDVSNFTSPVTGVHQPQWVRTCMSSPALGAVFDHVADRNQVTSSAVYVALSATAASVLSGRSAIAMRCMISNRFTTAEKYYIGNLSQACAFDVQVGTAVFDDIVKRAMSASIRGYMMGQYRTDQLEELIDPSRFDTMHNDFRDAISTRPQSLRSPAEITALRSQTVIDQPEPLSYYDDKFHVEIRKGSNGPIPAVLIDRRYIPVTEPMQILVAMEKFALTMLSGGRDRPAVEVMETALARS